MKESGRNDYDIKEGNLTYGQHREFQKKTLMANELKARDVAAILEAIRADVAAGNSEYTAHLSALNKAFDELDQLKAIAEANSKPGWFKKIFGE